MKKSVIGVGKIAKFAVVCSVLILLLGCVPDEQCNSCSTNESPDLCSSGKTLNEHIIRDSIVLHRIYLSQLLLTAKDEIVQNHTRFSVDMEGTSVMFIGRTGPIRDEYSYWMPRAHPPGILFLSFDNNKKIKKIKFRAGIPHMSFPDFDCEFNDFEEIEKIALEYPVLKAAYSY